MTTITLRYTQTKHGHICDHHSLWRIHLPVRPMLYGIWTLVLLWQNWPYPVPAWSTSDTRNLICITNNYGINRILFLQSGMYAESNTLHIILTSSDINYALILIFNPASYVIQKFYAHNIAQSSAIHFWYLLQKWKFPDLFISVCCFPKLAYTITFTQVGPTCDSHGG
jgi:hypothetical protein